MRALVGCHRQSQVLCGTLVPPPSGVKTRKSGLQALLELRDESNEQPGVLKSQAEVAYSTAFSCSAEKGSNAKPTVLRRGSNEKSGETLGMFFGSTHLFYQFILSKRFAREEIQILGKMDPQNILSVSQQREDRVGRAVAGRFRWWGGKERGDRRGEEQKRLERVEKQRAERHRGAARQSGPNEQERRASAADAERHFGDGLAGTGLREDFGCDFLIFFPEEN